MTIMRIAIPIIRGVFFIAEERGKISVGFSLNANFLQL
ncbi:hypothetical protein SEEN2570_10724 [Salmonella enterica subsp. enterica serovar Newport str. VA_R100512570]|nr:hypothetical protein SEENP078_00235 [Salmonella enterica subsp. enterica serovar Newport str. RI_10P078]ESC74017.1 hypothetical protein SEEN2570_10724 [Salmonella enterica subsp. enterica serovar Newport str. VA_R100512570]